MSIQGLGHRTIPLLICSGVGSDYQAWGELRERLPRTTVVFNVQGSFLGRRPSIRTYAAFLAALLDELDFACVDVLGHSWGGMAAQQLAHDHPDRVRRLILASSTPGWVSIPAKPTTALALFTPQRDADRLKRTIVRLCAGDLRKDADLPEKLGLLEPIDAPTYRRQIWAVTGWSSVPWLRQVKHQTLILHGSDDPLVPLINARLVAQLMPNASLAIITDGGHLFPYTRPDEVARHLTTFLEGSPLARTASRSPWQKVVRSANALIRTGGALRDKTVRMAPRAG